MSKIIVVDKCLHCPYATRWGCLLLQDKYLLDDEAVPEECPLPDLPERRPAHGKNSQQVCAEVGWNACLDQILRREEE